MKFTEKYSKAFQYLLPSPLSIAILLTFVTFLIAFSFTEGNGDQAHFLELMNYWEEGLWNIGLIVFAFQMMLMLILGHILALTPPVNRIISTLCKHGTNSAKAAFLVTLSTMILALFNWGLGLIFGAIITRKMGELARENNTSLNYPLIGAAGYSGLMVWHGGISGSSLTKIAETGHLKSLMSGILPDQAIALLPSSIPFTSTVFSPMNICATLLVITGLPILMYFLGKRKSNYDLSYLTTDKINTEKKLISSGAEKLDHSTWFAKIIGLFILSTVIIKVTQSSQLASFGFITPNFINLLLLSFVFLFHKNIIRLLNAADEAIGGAIGILIQFPLYFGIMGIMKGSGLILMLSDFFVSISDATTFPLFTLMSAGLVNVFVPSGGGQWAVQGPIIVQAAQEINVSLSKSVMALAYGDQLTNMLQPFWALPLLGITRLKAKEILPYTLLLMIVGSLIYSSVLLLF